MSKLLRQNVGGTDYTMAGCALSATCATAAATAAKVAELTDGDVLADGMSVAIQFTNGNTAASPLTLTVGGVTANICDSRGQNIGGNIWQAGNVVTFLYTFGKFLLLNCVVDEVTLNNMNSVSSNAVYKNGWFAGIPVVPSTVTSPIDYIDSLPSTTECHIIFRMINGHMQNTPYGNDVDADFFFDVYRLAGGAWVHVKAYDVRANRQFYLIKRDGSWQTWSNSVILIAEGGFVVGGQTKYYASRYGNVVQVSIDAFSGTTGLQPGVNNRVGTVAPVPLVQARCNIAVTDSHTYAIAWIDTTGAVYLNSDFPAGTTTNFALGCTFICA